MSVEHLDSGISNTSSWFVTFIAIAENPKKNQLSVIFQCERKKVGNIFCTPLDNLLCC